MVSSLSTNEPPIEKTEEMERTEDIEIYSPLAIAIFLSILYNLLPETGRLWLDWFRFPPNFIVRLGAILLLFALVCLLGLLGRKGRAAGGKFDQQHELTGKKWSLRNVFRGKKNVKLWKDPPKGN